MKSIKTKILLSMTLTVAVSLVIVGTVSILLSYRGTTATLEQTMRASAKVAADRVSQNLEAYKNIASDTGLLSRLSDPATTQAEKKVIIDQRVEAYGLVRGNILGADGVSVFDGNDYSDREYFKNAMQGKAFVSTPLVSKVTGELSVMVAAPIWKGGEPNSTVTGVVYFVPKETFLNEIVMSMQMSENGMAYMLDKNGYTIAHKNIDNVKNQENTVQDAKNDSSLAALAVLEGNMAAGQNGFGDYTYGGVQKFLAYAPVAGTDGWSIALNAPTSDFTGTTITGIIATIVLLVVAAIVAGIIAFFLANGIGKPMKACANRLELLAEGDLKSAVPAVRGRDETAMLAASTKRIVTAMSAIIQDLDWGLGEIASGNFDIDSKAKEVYVGDFAPLATSMYQILTQMSNTLAQINEAADQVSSGSDQVSSGAQALSQGATEQASSIEELAATIAEVSERIKGNADGARQASEQVSLVSSEMLESDEKMKRMIAAMAEISESSSQIGKIIKTIEDIAFQTNILALNAAVEAARAGEAGKGFAVVAGEVRSLASQSAEASKNTSVLIESAMRAVQNGTDIADSTAKTLKSAVNGAQQITRTVEGISEASEGQATSVAQITQGIDQISSVVQTNSATAEESAAASEELSGQAQMLKSLVGQFKLLQGTTGSLVQAEAKAAKAPAASRLQRGDSPADKY